MEIWQKKLIQTKKNKFNGLLGDKNLISLNINQHKETHIGII